MKHNCPSTMHCLFAAGVLILTTGCRHLPPPAPSGHIEAKADPSVLYTQVCTAMTAARTLAEFTAALSSLDDLTGLDFSKADPQGLITALGHGITLMKAADLKAETEARKSRSREKQLRLKIQSLEKTVKTLRHQISVLENIDQERQEKRKTQ